MKRIIPVLLLLAVAGWLVWSRYQKAEAEAGQYYGTVEAKSIQVGAKAGGRVAEVLVDEGQTVKAGDILVRFESNEVRALREQSVARLAESEAASAKASAGSRKEEIAQAEAAVAQARSQLAALRVGPRVQEREQATQELAVAEAERVQTEKTRARLETLAKSGDVSAQLLDDARARADAAQARTRALTQRLRLLQEGTRIEDLQAAEARLRQFTEAAALLRNGTRKEDLAQAKARVAQAAAQVAELDVRVRDAEVKSPAAALVETVSVRPGDLVAAGKAVATLREADQLWVRIFLPETELARVKLGDQVLVQADSAKADSGTFQNQSERWWNGQVAYIASQGEFLPRNVQTREDRNHLVFAIRVKLTEAGHPFKPGMSATLRFPALSSAPAKNGKP